MMPIIYFIIGVIFGMALHRISEKHRRNNGDNKRKDPEPETDKRVRIIYYDESAEVTEENWEDIKRWVQERDRLFVPPTKAWEEQFLGKFDQEDPEAGKDRE